VGVDFFLQAASCKMDITALFYVELGRFKVSVISLPVHRPLMMAGKYSP
jgi:hypothetical protein